MNFSIIPIVASWILPTIAMVRSDFKKHSSQHNFVFLYTIIIGCYLLSRLLASFAYYFVLAWSETFERFSYQPELLQPVTLSILFVIDTSFWLLFRRFSSTLTLPIVTIVSLAQSVLLIFIGMLLPMLSEAIVVKLSWLSLL